MHWRVDAEALRDLVPQQLPLDLYEGEAWLGVTPFRVSSFRLRGLPPAPVLSTFPETNVRTYVTYEGRPGIWFFSLDADSPWAVEAARRTYHLPYRHAKIHDERRGDTVDYRSGRSGARLDVTYRGTGTPAPAKRGTLDYFLTERYCLYTQHRSRLERAEIHHRPWPLQGAVAEIRENTMPPVAIEGDPLLHYSERQDVVIWPLEPVL